MAASALFVLDLKGRIILSRDYRGDVPAKNVEKFITKVNELEDTGDLRSSHVLQITFKLHERGHDWSSES